MLATVISALMSLALCVGVDMVPGFESAVVFPSTYFATFFFVCFFLSLMPWLGMLFLSQGAEVVAITIAGLRSNLSDVTTYVYSGLIQIVSLVGILICFQKVFPEMCSFSGAIICAGIALDLLRRAYYRLQYRRTPEGIGEWFIEVTKASVRRRDERWYAISFEIPFAMMLTYMKNGAYGSLRLFCNRIVDISYIWLSSMAGLLMFRVPTEFEDTLIDRYAHAELMTAKRIKWLLQEASSLGTIAGFEETSRLAGKLFISFYNCHKSLGSLLLQTVLQASSGDHGKMRSIDQNMEILSTMAEVVKMLINRSIDRNESEETMILKVLSMIEEKVKTLSLDEKAENLAFLLRPVVEIRHMLVYRRYRAFPGHELVFEALKRILMEFSTAEGLIGHQTESGHSVS
jgi:hypothetical protein